MRNRREIQRQKTRKCLSDALQRLQVGKPQRLAPPYKINVHSVEKEAGFSIGAMRNYPDIADMVRAVKLSQQEQLAGPNSKGLVGDKIERLLAEKKKQAELKEDYRAKWEHAERAIKQSHKEKAELLMAIHNLLSGEQRKRLYATKVVRLVEHASKVCHEDLEKPPL